MGGDRDRELLVPGCLEPSGAHDPMLAAAASDLDLVDVVEQRRGLHQRAVDRDLRLGQQCRRGAGNAGHPLGMADDAGGQARLVEQPPRGESIGYGHGPMLPATPLPCTARDVLHPASVLTMNRLPSVTSSMSPWRSVRYTSVAGRAARAASVSGAGWPYSFPAPEEITAT